MKRILKNILIKEEFPTALNKPLLLVYFHKSGTHLIMNVLNHIGLVKISVKGEISPAVLTKLKPNEFIYSH